MIGVSGLVVRKNSLASELLTGLVRELPGIRVRLLLISSLNSGGAAIRDGNPEQAEQEFREPKRLGLENPTARFYLSVALTLQHAPDCPETQHFLKESEQELLECLALDLSADNRRTADENLKSGKAKSRLRSRFVLQAEGLDRSEGLPVMPL